MTSGRYREGLPPALKHFRRCVTADYGRFTGRSPPAEFWSCYLVSLGLLALATGIGLSRGPDGLYFLVGLAWLYLAVPVWAAAVRRLHDVGYSGWWLALGLVPVAGLVVLVLLLLRPSDSSANRWGPPPSGQDCSRSSSG